LRLWTKRDLLRIKPYQEMVELRTNEWREKFGKLQGGKEIVSLTDETSADLRLLEKGNITVCMPTQWNVVSRRWRRHKNVQIRRASDGPENSDRCVRFVTS